MTETQSVTEITRSLIEITREAERLRDVENAARQIFEWACEPGRVTDPTLDPLLEELFGALDGISNQRRERQGLPPLV